MDIEIIKGELDQLKNELQVTVTGHKSLTGLLDILEQQLTIPVVSDSQRLKSYDVGYRDGYKDGCANKPMRKDLGVY